MDIAKRCNRSFDYECIQFAVRGKELRWCSFVTD